MKKFAMILFAVLLFSCEKPAAEEPVTTGTVTFWTTEYNGWILWVDGTEIGPVSKPYYVSTTDLIPNCDTHGFTKLKLAPGRHEFYIHLWIPQQPWPNTFTGQRYYFDVTLGGCTVVRVKQ